MDKKTIFAAAAKTSRPIINTIDYHYGTEKDIPMLWHMLKNDQRQR